MDRVFYHVIWIVCVWLAWPWGLYWDDNLSHLGSASGDREEWQDKRGEDKMESLGKIEKQVAKLT